MTSEFIHPPPHESVRRWRETTNDHSSPRWPLPRGNTPRPITLASDTTGQRARWRLAMNTMGWPARPQRSGPSSTRFSLAAHAVSGGQGDGARRFYGPTTGAGQTSGRTTGNPDMAPAWAAFRSQHSQLMITVARAHRRRSRHSAGCRAIRARVLSARPMESETCANGIYDRGPGDSLEVNDQCWRPRSPGCDPGLPRAPAWPRAACCCR